jgi:hypothetical protein
LQNLQLPNRPKKGRPRAKKLKLIFRPDQAILDSLKPTGGISSGHHHGQRKGAQLKEHVMQALNFFLAPSKLALIILTSRLTGAFGIRRHLEIRPAAVRKSLLATLPTDISTEKPWTETYS